MGRRRRELQKKSKTGGHTGKEDTVVFDAIILESLPNAQFRVQIVDTDHEVLAYISGKMRKYYIRLMPGDKVTVEMSPYDMERGRITYRAQS